MGELARGRSRRQAIRAAVLAGLLALAGCWTDIGVPEGFTNAQAVDVNAGGTILAVAAGPEMESARAYIVDTEGNWSSLGTLPQGGAEQSVVPASIADDGRVVGTVSTDGLHIPFVWTSAGGMTTLVAYPNSSGWYTATTSDIGDGGVVVGTSNGVRGWRVDVASGDNQYLAPALGYETSSAVAVNASGAIVGTSADGANVAPTLWAPPAYEPVILDDMGAPIATAEDIGDDGTIVGTVWPADNLPSAVYWDATSHAVQELEPDAVSSLAHRIDGDIVIGDNDFPCNGGVCGGQAPAAWNLTTGAVADLDSPKQTRYAALDGPHFVGTRGVDGRDQVIHRGRPSFD